jgi:mannose-6-phosphate isomerase-like protein (cupin superfamily)
MTASAEGPSTRVEVCRRHEAKPLMEGAEFALIYFHTNRIVFSATTLPAGGTSTRDPGHPGADEVVYCVSGQVVIEVGDNQGEFVLLHAGEAALIHEGVPHTASNPGPEQANMIWAAAPHLGRPLVYES